MDAEPLWQLWLEERPKYELLCKHVEGILDKAIRKEGIVCHIYSRTKEPSSLLKKVLRKDYSEPYEEIRDKAGVRVVCTYRETLPELESIIRKCFRVCHYEDKSLGLGYDRLGYLGIHFEVKCQEHTEGVPEEILDLVCEIQLLTRGQSLWADVSHEFAYKAAQEPPDAIKRAIHLQEALVELFDIQASRIRDELLHSEGFQESRILQSLDKHYVRLTATPYDRELSLSIIEKLLVLFSEQERERLDLLLEQFITDKLSTIKLVFEQYPKDDDRSLLLFQPECLLIYMCMTRNMFELKRIWAQFAPLGLLRNLADILGENIGMTC